MGTNNFVDSRGEIVHQVPSVGDLDRIGVHRAERRQHSVRRGLGTPPRSWGVRQARPSVRPTSDLQQIYRPVSGHVDCRRSRCRTHDPSESRNRRRQLTSGQDPVAGPRGPTATTSTATHPWQDDHSSAAPHGRREPNQSGSAARTHNHRVDQQTDRHAESPKVSQSQFRLTVDRWFRKTGRNRTAINFSRITART